MAMENGSEKKVVLIYDNQCPVCHYYCNVVNIRKSVGTLLLIDARQSNEYTQEITNRGWDIDEGMVLVLESSYYYADDAIHMLSLIGSRKGVFNRFNYYLFKNRSVARYVYPMMKAGRNLLMKLLGKSRINNLQIAGRDKF